jgi:hypothetical protein
MSRDFRKIFRPQQDSFSFKSRARRNYKIKRYRQFDWRIFLVLFFFLLVLAVFIYFIFFTDKFLIKEVQVVYDGDAPKLVKNEQIIKTINGYYQGNSLLSHLFLRRNILFFNSSVVKRLILEDQRIDQVKIIKKIPNVLVIKISEVKPVARLIIFGGEDQWLLGNNQSVPFYAEDALVFGHLPIIYDKTSFSLKQNKMKLAFSNILDFINNKSDQVIFPLIIIQEEAGVLKIIAQSEEGWQAFFIPDKNFSQQINNLNTVLREKLRDRNSLEYIDLRFGNRIYYKKSI